MVSTPVLSPLRFGKMRRLPRMKTTRKSRFDFPCSFPTFHLYLTAPPTTAGTLDKRYPNRPRARFFSLQLCRSEPLRRIQRLVGYQTFFSSSLPRLLLVFFHSRRRRRVHHPQSLPTSQNLYRRNTFCACSNLGMVRLCERGLLPCRLPVSLVFPSLRVLFVFVAIVSHWLPQLRVRMQIRLTRTSPPWPLNLRSWTTRRRRQHHRHL
mmetsp:Transcript_4253/g.13112  ORF Transcript_4253/g.13112 Transcript_4253/m.13112 type:complete len:208 (+) Transcript_4253:127-750(+)